MNGTFELESHVCAVRLNWASRNVGHSYWVSRPRRTWFGDGVESSCVFSEGFSSGLIWVGVGNVSGRLKRSLSEAFEGLVEALRIAAALFLQGKEEAVVPLA